MVEFALSLPSRFKVRHGTTKFLMRTSLAQHLPAGMATAEKRGFLPPLAARFAGPWGAQAGGMLAEACDGFGIERRPVMAMLDEHRAGRRDHAQRLWLVCQLALFLRNSRSTLSLREHAAVSDPTGNGGGTPP